MAELTSIIIPVCNQGDWARYTVDQVKQSMGDRPHEIIVVDDQSTDGSCHNMPQDVVILRSNDRLGVSQARRFAVEQSKGDSLIFCDPHCTFPGNALQVIDETARRNWAVVQPPTKRSPEGKRIAWGGKFVTTERGLSLGNAPKGFANQALINTIYALRRVVYDRIGGWPALPGCWGYSEQAMSLATWYADIPITIALVDPCIHHLQHVDNQLSFSCSTLERATNGHYVHACYLPSSYQDHWKPILDAKHGKIEECKAAIRSEAFKAFCAVRRRFWVRKEEDLYREIFNGQKPSKVSKSFQIQQKQAPTKENRHVLKHSLKWFIDNIPGCAKGRALLDLGTATGKALDVAKELEVRHCEGVELISSRADEGIRNGRIVRVGDITNLVTDLDGTWDIVTILNTLQCIKEPAKVIKEAARLLRYNGWLFITVPKKAELTTEDIRSGENYCFKDIEALKELIAAEPELIDKTIKTGVVAYKGNKEMRLIVKKMSTDRRMDLIRGLVKKNHPDQVERIFGEEEQ